MESFENQFLHQIFAGKEHVKTSQSEMLENIFNIYDYDGDGKLNEEEYLTFMSDIMYISVLMKRLPEREYHLETVSKITRWSSSNFKTNLFRVPLTSISHDLFVDGIIYALTENENLPIFPGNNMYVISFVPELIHYFHYYVDVAKRRGWPTELSVEPSAEAPIEAPIEAPVEAPMDPPVEPLVEPSVEAPIEAPMEPLVEPLVEPELENSITEIQPNSQDQITEYQERRRKKFQEEKERQKEEKEREQKEKEEEHQRVLRERHEEQDRVNRELFEQQQRLEAERRLQEQRNLQQQQQQQILQLQVQQLQQLQARLRQHIRQEELNQGVDQIDGQVQKPPLEDIGELDVDTTEEGYEPIEGNVNVLQFMRDNSEDHVVFRCGDSYYLASRDRIRMMIQIGEKDNSLFYGCMCEIEGDWTLPQTWALLQPNVIVNPIYYNIQQLGLPIRYVYLDDIMQVLSGSHHYFTIEKPEDYNIIPSFASDNVLNHGIGSMSGLHCQEGQSDVVYRIKRFTPVEKKS